MNLRKIPKAESDDYMEGWVFRHKHGPLTIPDKMVSDAWAKGFSDCCQGRIDARWALGPELITPEDRI